MPKTNLEKKLFKSLTYIYGQEQAASLYPRIIERVDQFLKHNPKRNKPKSYDRFSERDSILITYGNMVHSEGLNPLSTQAKFLQKYLGEAVSTVHILPFFPYSSDDGFSVIDYLQVDPDLGDWSDIAKLGENFRLMFDAVVNHISTQSEWFQGFSRGDAKFQDYFIEVDSDFDTSQVFRPRALPLITPIETVFGEKKVWTTFSPDQIDLNFSSPEVLLAVLDVFLTYVGYGAEFIRLDAIAFIWKESGTRCLHLPQTHRIIQLLRTVLDMVATGVSIITETNVPHVENISYFGDGVNEAQMVYNFSLPPLTLHAFHTGSAEVLSEWAKTLTLPSDQATFFNFLASHDGIGLMPAQGILPEEVIQNIAARVETLGGFVSYNDNPDGSQTAYELNINYLDALGDPDFTEEDTAVVAKRFLASQAIMLALRGIPGIYFHSLFGSRNWREGVEQTGRYRTINREKLALEKLESELAVPYSLRHSVFHGYRRMLEARKNDPAFHTNGGQEVLALHPSIFALLRSSLDDKNHTICLTNVSDQHLELTLDSALLSIAEAKYLIDKISLERYPLSNFQVDLTIAPYQVLWLTSHP